MKQVGTSQRCLAVAGFFKKKTSLLLSFSEKITCYKIVAYRPDRPLLIKNTECSDEPYIAAGNFLHFWQPNLHDFCFIHGRRFAKGQPVN